MWEFGVGKLVITAYLELILKNKLISKKMRDLGFREMGS